MKQALIFEERKVSWLELFFDLVFVTAVASTTHLLLSVDHHPERTLLYFGEYLLMVTPMFWAWVGQTMFFNRFGEKISFPAFYMLPQMFFLVLMTASFDLDFDDTFYTFIIGYAGIRLITVLQYFIVSRKERKKRKQVARLLGTIFLVGILLSLSAVFFTGVLRYSIVYAGIAIDILLPLLFTKTLRQAPVHLPHLVERFGLFVIITFGESIVAITTLLVGHTTDPYTLFFTLTAFLIIGTMWASYFYSFEHHVDQTKATNGQVLLYGHFFIIVSVMLLAANIHLLYAGHLQKEILLLLLYGAAAVFFLAKQIVFSYHKKAEVIFDLWKDLLLFGLLILFFFVNAFTTLPMWNNFICLWLVTLVDLLIRFQASRHLQS
ncbi:low temperature requirement protein A [Listeria costaricensis]|uniref:low temperature requirement protein A n=1 Tax=Listeria costaricensis TaxID=2026604 RepID=UPI000C07BCB6|nr:low temperature requirement protein A [Listeria costaricensis]